MTSSPEPHDRPGSTRRVRRARVERRVRRGRVVDRAALGGRARRRPHLGAGVRRGNGPDDLRGVVVRTPRRPAGWFVDWGSRARKGMHAGAGRERHPFVARQRERGGDSRSSSLPVRFFVTEWAHLDAFAWRDPASPSRGYLVTELEGSTAGVVLRAAERTGSHHRAAICNLCHTQQPGDQVVHVLGATGRRRRRARRQHRHLHLQRPRVPGDRAARAPAGAVGGAAERLEIERIEGLARRTRAFVADVLGAVPAA